MKIEVYQLDCLTNIHMGDGEVNYNIIDNQVQRDVVLGVPTIHSSGVKGSIKNYAVQNGYSNELLQELFGDAEGKGNLKFFAGNLITRPLRISHGEGGYVNATSLMMINNELEFLKALGLLSGKNLTLPVSKKEKVIVSEALENGVEVEEMQTEVVSSTLCPILTKMAGERWALLTDDEFISFDLPVQARNSLEKGISQALWYEEVVPHKSRFYFAVMEEIGENTLLKLNSLIDGSIIQFGADASIGYGYCKISRVDGL